MTILLLFVNSLLYMYSLLLVHLKYILEMRDLIKTVTILPLT